MRMSASDLHWKKRRDHRIPPISQVPRSSIADEEIVLVHRPCRSLGSTGRNAAYKVAQSAGCFEAILRALTDISRIERERHIAKLQVNDLGHRTRDGVTSFAVTENLTYALAPSSRRSYLNHAQLTERRPR